MNVCECGFHSVERRQPGLPGIYVQLSVCQNPDGLAQSQAPHMVYRGIPQCSQAFPYSGCQPLQPALHSPQPT